MDAEFAEGNFLGLPDPGGAADIVVAPVPYELTTSYGQGTADGPAACIEASGQVELYDDLLKDELPAGKVIRTAEPWDCLLYTSPSPRDRTRSRMPSSA